MSIDKGVGTKRVGIIQSSYIPWRGYFDFIDSVDLFIIYDDIEYSKGSWRNRNQIKTEHGLKWLTVPVQSGAGSLPIDLVLIGQSNKPWKESHCRMLEEALEPASFFKDAMDLWEEGTSVGDTYISSLNVRLIKLVCNYLQIKTPIVMSRDYEVTGAKTERLTNLIRKVGGTTYISGPTAKGYLDEDLFRKNGIRLEYKSYDYPPYPQLWGDFVGTVTVLDLIANTGSDARKYLKTITSDVVAVE